MKQTIIIYADDDEARLLELRRDIGLAEAEHEKARKAATRYGDGDLGASEKVQAAEDAYDAFVDEAAERAEAWELSSIGHGEFRDLLATHPARKVDNDDTSEGAPKQVVHPEDRQFGVDTSTFGEALLTFKGRRGRRTIIEPTEDLLDRLEDLSAGQFDTLWVTAYYLNLGGPSDPKAMRFSTDPTSNEI